MRLPAAVAVLTVLWAAYTGRFWLAPPPPLTSADDGVLYVAAALHLREPSLFVGDWAFQALAPIVEPLVYTRALALLVPWWWDAPEAMLRALSRRCSSASSCSASSRWSDRSPVRWWWRSWPD